MYRVQISKSVIKELTKLPTKEALRITRKIHNLKDEPRPSGCVKLAGGTNEYRIRIGNYRVLYTIEDKVLLVQVFKVANRRDAYNK